MLNKLFAAVWLYIYIRERMNALYPRIRRIKLGYRWTENLCKFKVYNSLLLEREKEKKQNLRRSKYRHSHYTYTYWRCTHYKCTVIPLFLLNYAHNFIANFSTTLNTKFNYKVNWKIKKTCRKHLTSSSREHIDKSNINCFLLQDMRFSYCYPRNK